MTRFLTALLLLVLAACGGGGPIPIPPAPPLPPSPVLTANFTPGTFNVQAWCEQDTPVPCNPDLPPGTLWTSFNRPGDAGLGCVGFGPNNCWHLDGGFVTSSLTPGFPLISTQTFDHTKPYTIRAVMSAHCTDPACWAGEVLYNGESNWVSIYYSYLDSTHVRLSVWTPNVIVVIFDSISMDQLHTVDLISDGNCGVSAAVDGAIIPVGAPANHVCITDDWHVAGFAGLEELTVKSLMVF